MKLIILIFAFLSALALGNIRSPHITVYLLKRPNTPYIAGIYSSDASAKSARLREAEPLEWSIYEYLLDGQ